jgi:hypothetical protein
MPSPFVVTFCPVFAAADAVLVAHHLAKQGAYLVSAHPVEEIAWMQKARVRKKAGGGQQVIKNSAAVQQNTKRCTRLYVFSGKLR